MLAVLVTGILQNVCEMKVLVAEKTCWCTDITSDEGFKGCLFLDTKACLALTKGLSSFRFYRSTWFMSSCMDSLLL